MLSYSPYAPKSWPPAGLVPASQINPFASEAPYAGSSDIYGTLSYSSWTDLEPETESTSLSGYGMASGANPRLGFWIKNETYIESLYILPLKTRSKGGWGWAYHAGGELQYYDAPSALWKTLYTFPTDLTSKSDPTTPCSAVLAPDGKPFLDRRVVKIPIQRKCLGLRVAHSVATYLCASVFAPTIS